MRRLTVDSNTETYSQSEPRKLVECPLPITQAVTKEQRALMRECTGQSDPVQMVHSSPPSNPNLSFTDLQCPLIRPNRVWPFCPLPNAPPIKAMDVLGWEVSSAGLNSHPHPISSNNHFALIANSVFLSYTDSYPFKPIFSTTSPFIHSIWLNSPTPSSSPPSSPAPLLLLHGNTTKIS